MSTPTPTPSPMSAIDAPTHTPPAPPTTLANYNGTPYRCKACKTLLAVLTPAGYEIQLRRTVIAVIGTGELHCRNCRRVHRVTAPTTSR